MSSNPIQYWRRAARLAAPAAVAALVTVMLWNVGGAESEALAVDTTWFQSKHWEDGAADVSVFKGRVYKYGTWHDAEARDFLIREFMDSIELTKRDQASSKTVPVLKANRLIRFDTGPYDYRLMSSLFFERASGQLVKGVGSSQEACGLTFQRWDRASERLGFDSYWEGEGQGTQQASRRGISVFRDELPFLAARLSAGARLRVLPSLTSNSMRGHAQTPVRVRVTREGLTTRLLDDAGREFASFSYDLSGALDAWSYAGAEEFKRVSKQHSYYWLRETTDPDCGCAEPK